MKTKYIRFSTFREWFNHLCDAIEGGRRISVINYNAFEAEDSDDDYLLFYNDESEYPIRDILVMLINTYGDNIYVESGIDYFEDDNEYIPYKYLNVCSED